MITGVAGDGVKETTNNVTMKVLGTTYTNPVHVYKVESTLANETSEIFSKGGRIGDTTFVNTAELNVVAQVDSEDVTALAWTNTNESAATVADGAVTAVEKSAFFASETASVSFSFEFAGETFASNACEITVSFPIAYKTAPKEYGDLMQNVFNSDSSALVATTEDVKTIEGFDGNVTNFFSSDFTKDLLSDGKTNANVYGTNEAGEKNFVVISDNGYGYMVKATVVSYAIANKAQLLYFLEKTYHVDGTHGKYGAENSTYGMYVILSGKINFTGEIFGGTSAKYDTNGKVWAGTFDGRGNEITDIYFVRGFFSIVGGDGVIKNLALTNVSGNAYYQFGVIANELYGKIDNCFVQGEFTTTTKNRCGVFNSAYAGSRVTNCIVAVEFTATADNHYLVGRATSGTVENCYGISGSETKVVGTSTDNGCSSANDFCDKVTSLPSGFNSYWSYTGSELKFGTTTVFTIAS